MSECTPTRGDVLEAWVAHQGHDQLTALDLVDGYDSFNRWLAAEKAKWQAEALREAAEGLHAGMRGSKCNPACHEADQITLRLRANRIEKGSDDDR